MRTTPIFVILISVPTLRSAVVVRHDGAPRGSLDTLVLRAGLQPQRIDGTLFYARPKLRAAFAAKGI